MIQDIVIEGTIKQMIADGTTDADDIVCELYNDELNFNNADPTSGQRVWTEAQLKAIVDKELSRWLTQKHFVMKK